MREMFRQWYRTAVLWHCGTVSLWVLWSCGTVAHGTAVLWRVQTVVVRLVEVRPYGCDASVVRIDTSGRGGGLDAREDGLKGRVAIG